MKSSAKFDDDDTIVVDVNRFSNFVQQKASERPIVSFNELLFQFLANNHTIQQTTTNDKEHAMSAVNQNQTPTNKTEAKIVKSNVSDVIVTPIEVAEANMSPEHYDDYITAQIQREKGTPVR